jgi:hypothetical protein
MASKKKPVPPSTKMQQNQSKAVENTPKAKPQPVATPSPVTRSKVAAVNTLDFAFGKINYILMLGGIALIILGFVLMIGGGSTDPKVFNESIFDTQRMTVAPILILLGFAVEIYAILKKPGK